ncbi:MAG TPA: DUF4240 domain-containing protein [Labilithrix sp.]|nr:DUF4240 domain-containing protein [Labilithrix sp.]
MDDTSGARRPQRFVRDVRATFGLSTKAFKRAVGRLLKEGSVSIETDAPYILPRDLHRKPSVLSAAAMDHARFWSIIDGARSRRGCASTSLVRALEGLPAGEIAAFDRWFWTYYLATARQDLWAAVYAICGGCSDDSFDYFRGRARSLAATSTRTSAKQSPIASHGAPTGP